MNSSVAQLFDKIYEALDDLHDSASPGYDIARHELRDAKYDQMLSNDISNADTVRLTELEGIARLKHKNYCDAIMNVRDVVEQAINAMGNIDGQDGNNERLSELQQILNELPACPPESDFLDITDIDDGSLDTDDEDEIISLSDDDDDDEEEEEENVAGEPINQKNLSLLERIVEKSKVMKALEADLKQCADLKHQSKTEMFARREREMDITQQQQDQRNLFNKINELKINYRRVKAEVKEMIQDVMPNLNDFSQERKLMELFEKIQQEDAIDKSQEKLQDPPSQRSKIPKRPSGIPRLPQKQPENVKFQSKIPQIQTRPQSPVKPSKLPTRIPQIVINQRPTSTSQTPPKAQVSRIPIRSKEAEHIPSKIPRMPARLSQTASPQYQVPKQMPGSRIPQRYQPESKQVNANLKIAESIGNIRKVHAKPVVLDGRPDDINRLKKTLTTSQRENLKKQNEIKAKDAVSRMFDDIDEQLKKITSSKSAKERKEEEKREIEMFIESVVNTFCKPLGDGNLSHEEKMSILERKLEITLSEVDRIKKLSRKSFKPDESSNQQFITTVLNHFAEAQNFENYQEILAEFLRQFTTQKQSRKPNQLLHSTPTSPMRGKRFSDASRIPPPRRPSSLKAVGNVKAKVQSELNKLEETNLQKSSTQAAIKKKLDKFVNTFCKIFLLNQRNRRNKFEIWVKTFRNNLNPILNDLDAFYKSLPHPELKKFNRQQVEQSLERLLHQVYEQTRKYELTNVKCKDLIGNEMEKLMEQKQLKNINTSLGVFLQGIKELMEPYVEEREGEEEEANIEMQEEQDSPSIMQKSKHSTGQGRGRQSLLQKVHESNIQRALHRTLMNETGDEESSIEYPSFNESLLQQVSAQELKSMYKKMMEGRYQTPNVQSTARQAMMLEKIERMLRAKAEQGIAKKRDKSFLRSHGGRTRRKSLMLPIYEKLAPSSINIFERVIGANEILETIEITDEMLKVLEIVLECCENVDENISKVLMNQHRKDISSLNDSLSNLVGHLKSFVYDNNELEYGRELARLDKLHEKLDVTELKLKLGQRVFSKSECENLLENVFNIEASPENASYSIFEFVRNLRYMEYKYILKILKGEIRGDVVISYTDESSTSKAPSSSYLDRIKTVQPYQIIKDYNYPHDLIERDILYVACQLTNQNEFEFMEHDDTDEYDDDSDRNGHMDSLSRHIIQVAQKYQQNRINERDALRIIGQIFYMLKCIPIDFYQRFIYHVDNEYFGAIRFNNQSLNAAARIETIAMRNRVMCAEDKLMYGRQVTQITDQIERFMFVFDNEIEEIARSFHMLDRRGRFNVQIRGNEVSNNENGVLGMPKAISTESGTSGKIDNVQLSLVLNQPPISNVAKEDILKKLDEIEAALDRQLREGKEHFENSKVAKAALKFELQPNAIKRKNYWQCRGSEIPKWFPGFHTVFPNQCRPMAYSIEQILPHAWRMMAPINYK